MFLDAHQRSRPAASRSGYPATYWVLVVAYGASRVGAVLVPYLTYYLVSHLHLSTAEVGRIMSAFGAGWVVGQPLAGAAADHVGRKPTIVLAQLLTAATYLLLIRTTSPMGLVAVAALIGLCFDGARAGVGAWIADLVPEERRSRSYGVQYWLLNAGAAVGGVLGGYLAATHITWLCVSDALATAAFAGIILTLHSPERTTTPARPTPHRYRAVLADHRLLSMTALSLVTLTAYQQISYGLPLTIHSTGLSAAVFGAVNVVNAVTVLVLQPLLQPAMDRAHPLRSCAVGALAIGTGMGANAFAHDALGFCMAAVLWTIGEITFCVGAATHVARLAPEAARGRYLGVWGSAFGGSALLAPLLGAAALSYGATWLWSGAALAGVTCAAALLRQGQRASHTQPTPSGSGAPAIPPAST